MVQIFHPPAGGVLVSNPTDLQAVWDALPSSGGATLEFRPNQTVQSDGTLVNWKGKDDITVKWNNLTIKPPATVNRYELLRIGNDDQTGTISRLITSNVLVDANSCVVASVASLVEGAVVLLFNGTNYHYNRIQFIDPVLLRVWFDYPIGFAMTVAASVGVYTLPNIMKGFRAEGRVTVKNSANTNYGLAPGVVLGTTTTVPAGSARGLSTVVVTSFAGFADADYVLISDGAYHEVRSISSHVGTTVTLDAPHYRALSAATTMSKLTGGLTDMQPSVGIRATYLDTPFFEDFYGEGVIGSAFAGERNYKPHYVRQLAQRCSFGFNPVGYDYAHALQYKYETGGQYDFIHSYDSTNWGPGTDMVVSAKGSFIGTGNFARNVKHSWLRNSDLDIIAQDNLYATGAAVTTFCEGNVIRVRAQGNGGDGFWTGDLSSSRNVFYIYARNNNLNAVDHGDVYFGATDSPNVAYILNSDAVIVDNGNCTRYADRIYIPASGAQIVADGTPDLALRGDAASNFLKYQAWAFDGAAIEDIVLQEVELPSDWSSAGQVAVYLHWAPSDNNTGNVFWRVLGAAVTAGDQEDVAQEFLLDGLGAAGAARDKVVRTLLGSFFTPDGPRLRLAVARIANDATDTYDAHDAWFVGLELDFYRKRVP